MSKKDFKLKGVIPPMITPFKENGDVDYSAFQANIEKWNENKLSGYLVLGSNSETAYLTEEEKIELVKLTVKHAAPGRHILAGTGMESLRETIRFTNVCADLGVNSALVLTPFYYDSAMNTAVLVDFFTKLADASKIPILIYNVTKFTHVNINVDAVAELSKHPNIVGMKDSNGDVPQIATFLRSADKDYNIMVGTASAWYPALTMGVKAGVMALANCMPNECAAVQEAYENGEFEKAYAIYQALFPVNAAVTGTYGIPGLKVACDMLGYKGGFVRSPLLGCSETNKAKINDIVNTALAKIREIK